MADQSRDSGGDDPLKGLDEAKNKMEALTLNAKAFEAAMTRAFVQAVAGGKSFEDVLKQLALQMSSMVVAQAFRPVANYMTSQAGGLLSSVFGGTPTASSAPSGNAPASNVTVQIAAPDLGSFRRSESYLTGQIARAVARGQRSL